MAIRINPNLIDELEHYGARDVAKCYQCGNCSAACALSGKPAVFPRKSMHALQLGLEAPLRSMLEPWLCYYCGDCSEQCPREAEPGETMMSMRRWLTSRYDFTGIARLFYTSWKAELAFVVIVALITGFGLSAYGFSKGSIHIYDGSGAFLPGSMIHAVDLALMVILSTLLAINVIRMWLLIMADPEKMQVPWWLYLKKIYLLPAHFFSQRRYAQCGPENTNRVRIPWMAHMGIVLGYCAMLLLIVFALEQLQAGPEIQWSVHGIGYLASAGLLIGTTYVLYSRLKKAQVQHQRSHSTDWMFLWLLLYMVVTGIIQHVLHRAGWLEAANIAYVAHLMGVFSWLLRMPFSKWAHLIYRPLAIYFAQLQQDAQALKTENAAVPVEPAEAQTVA